MNQSFPPSDQARGGGQQGAPFGSGFFAWLRGLGMSRGGDRWFAGVAGGIAARAGIDPIIVRGIFIVLAVLGGPGILLYLAGWLLLPDQGGRIHLEEVLRGRAGTAAVVATVAVGFFVLLPVAFRIIGVTSVGGWSLWNALGMPGWLSTTLAVFVWIAVIVALAFLASHLFLQHGRKVRANAAEDLGPATSSAAQTGVPSWVTAASATAAAQPGSAQPATEQPATDQSTPASAYEPTTGFSGPSSAEQPTAQFATAPQGEPLPGQADWTQKITDGAERVSERATKWSEDVGKQADEWSAKYAAEHDKHKLGAAHVVITLALSLLAAGGAALIALDWGVGSSLVLTAALLGATSVMAVSLIVAGVRGRHTGWIGFLAFCGIVALLFTSVLPSGTRFQPFGVVDVGADSTGQLLIAGSTRIDLSAAEDDAELEVWHLFGNSRLVIPEEEPVVVTVRIFAGNIDSTGTDAGPLNSSGPLISRTIDTRKNSAEAAPRVTVNMVAGNVVVRESPVSSARTEASGSRTSREAATRAALRDEIAELRSEEADILAELGDGELTEVREARLENSLEFTRTEITKLEKELDR